MNSTIWLLLSDKLGDNAQVEALARELALPYETKRLLMRERFVLGKPRFRPSLEHIDADRSDRLEPPWPDLAITIGRRPSMAALWIKECSPETRIVLVGRPKRWLERFDLVIAPPQFLMPEAANVVQLRLPLMRADPTRVAAAAEVWKSRLEDMPRPLTAVLVGGQTRPFRFDAEAARDLARELAVIAERDGGSFYLTTSRRTGGAAAEALAQALPRESRIYRFGEDPPEDNPYLALLGMADRFVVTGDSISMQVEVLGLGKPLAVFELPLSRLPHVRLWRAMGALLEPGRPLGEFLRRLGITGFVRDIGAFHQQLYDQGLAVPLGEPFRAPSGEIADELAGAAAAVRRLLPRERA